MDVRPEIDDAFSAGLPLAKELYARTKETEETKISKQ